VQTCALPICKKFWPLTSEKRSVVITIQRGLQFFWALVPAQVYAGRDGWFGDERPAILYPNCFASGYLRHWSVSWSCLAGNETDVGGVRGGWEEEGRIRGWKRYILA